MTSGNDVILYICGGKINNNFIFLALFVKVEMKSKIPLL